MKFSEVKLEEKLGGTCARISYGDYTLSLVKNSHTYGGDEGLYEIGLFKGDGMIGMPGITADHDTVKGWLTEENVDEIMEKMVKISGTDGSQVAWRMAGGNHGN